MPEICHQFGDQSRACRHRFGISRRRHNGDSVAVMIKGKFPNGLAAAMKRAGIGITELAKRADVAKQNVQRHRDGERRLTREWAERYSPYVGESAERLVFHNKREPRAKATTPSSAPATVPLVSWVSAGRLAPTVPVMPQNVRKTLAVAGLPRGDWIALEVDGDSMDRIAPSGAIIFVDRSDNEPKNNRFYVFAAADGDATFKRYRANPDRLQPFSTNPDHETIPAEEGWMVLGRVRRVTLDI